MTARQRPRGEGVTALDPHPLLLCAAATLAAVLVALAVSRPPRIELPPGDWRCSASHEDRRAVHRGDGGIEVRIDVICDEWRRK